jgi:hypothetical protein
VLHALLLLLLVLLLLSSTSLLSCGSTYLQLCCVCELPSPGVVIVPVQVQVHGDAAVAVP